MKKQILFSFILFFSLLSTFAQSQNIPVNPVKGPAIQFAATSHDFKMIDEGIKVSHDFEFMNTGDSNLILVNVQASCGCTVPIWPKQPIKPGEKGTITVVYNSSRHGGENFHQSITITTNLKQDNVRIIYIKGQVAPKTSSVPQPTPPMQINQNH